MIAVLAAGLSVAAAALIALAGDTGGSILTASVALAVLALAVGWGPLLGLPHGPGTAVLVGGTGAAALAVAELDGGLERPLAGFAGVIAGAVLAAFGHELVRRDGRGDAVASITGTLAGQVLATLAAAWLLVPATDVGPRGVLVGAVALAAARLPSAFPLPPLIGVWAALLLGIGAAAAAAVAVGGVATGTALLIGAAVAAAAVAADRMLGPELVDAVGAGRTPAVLAVAAAPVVVAGTVAYAALRLVPG